MKPRIARSVVSVPPREPDRRDADYTSTFKHLPCLACGRSAPYIKVDPHHLVRGLPPKERGTSRKAHDKYCVPCCRECHDKIHGPWRDDDEAFFASLGDFGVDARSIASALWRQREAPDGMRRVIERSLLARGINA